MPRDLEPDGDIREDEPVIDDERQADPSDEDVDELPEELDLPIEVPEADAIEQQRSVPVDDTEER